LEELTLFQSSALGIYTGCAALRLFRSIFNTVYPSASLTKRPLQQLLALCLVASTMIRLKGHAAALVRKTANSARNVRERIHRLRHTLTSHPSDECKTEDCHQKRTKDRYNIGLQEHCVKRQCASTFVHTNSAHYLSDAY
jgi:hypothetical protein